jgi:hypothetical protein
MKRKLAKYNQVSIINDPEFFNKYTSWLLPSNAPSDLFPPTSASVIGHTLATDNSEGYLSASAITIRACNHDGVLHLNEDLFCFQESAGGVFIREKSCSQFHRYPSTGSYPGLLTWDTVHRYFGVPSEVQGDVNAFLNERGKVSSMYDK